MSTLFAEAVAEVCKSIKANKEYLTELDAAIGDADHGINLCRGFDAVMEELKKCPDMDLSSLLKKIGMTLITTVGGASGPLYGTAFLRAAAAVQGSEQIDAQTAASMLAASIQGIKDRGKAARGEKTMLDALEPAYEAYIVCLEGGGTLAVCLDAASKAAEEGAEYTKTIRASKGRASYLGDRSIGHKDPGAASSHIILKTLAVFCAVNT